MYHYVRPIAQSKYPNIKGLELDLFKEQVKFFASNFSPVTMEQVVDSMYKRTKLPDNPILLTFDDGYKDHYQYVFPILKEHGMQGSFFVPSEIINRSKVLDVNKIHFILACSDIHTLIPRILSILDEYREKNYDIEDNQSMYAKLAIPNRWDSGEVIFAKRLLQTYLEENLRGEIVDRLFNDIVGEDEHTFSKKLYMSIDEIKEMKAAGMFFGLHGERHYWLNNLPAEKMRQDVNNGLTFFRDVIDKEYIVMNYPYGGYNEEVAAYMKEIGCKLGITVDARVADLGKDDPYLMPRLDTNDFPPKSNYWEEL